MWSGGGGLGNPRHPIRAEPGDAAHRHFLRANDAQCLTSHIAIPRQFRNHPVNPRPANPRPANPRPVIPFARTPASFPYSPTLAFPCPHTAPTLRSAPVTRPNGLSRPDPLETPGTAMPERRGHDADLCRVCSLPNPRGTAPPPAHPRRGAALVPGVCARASSRLLRRDLGGMAFECAAGFSTPRH